MSKVETVGYECGGRRVCTAEIHRTHHPATALVRREAVIKWLRERALADDDGPALNRAADALEADGD